MIKDRVITRLKKFDKFKEVISSDCYTPEELADMFGISTESVYRMYRGGQRLRKISKSDHELILREVTKYYRVKNIIRFYCPASTARKLKFSQDMIYKYYWRMSHGV